MKSGWSSHHLYLSLQLVLSSGHRTSGRLNGKVSSSSDSARRRLEKQLAPADAAVTKTCPPCGTLTPTGKNTVDFQPLAPGPFEPFLSGTCFPAQFNRGGKKAG